MKQSLQEQPYPVFVLELNRNETGYRSVDEIIGYLENAIRDSGIARVIAVFDHYEHTRNLQLGQIAANILAAKNLLFCFGLSLPDPAALALRPRSLGVAETTTGFVISFLEAPMPVANQLMEDWVKALANREAA